MDSRQHRRVHMRLPVRLRWTAPFGQKIESAETINVSRGGLLVSTKHPHTPDVQAWVTFPYDALLPAGQPEVPARVVRCHEMSEAFRAATAREKVQLTSAPELRQSANLPKLASAVGDSDTPATLAVALQFREQPHYSSNGSANRREPERRGSMRRALAVPIRVHPERIPWFEEAMTVDISSKGMRFRSQREYEPGDHLKIAFQDLASAPWHGAGEFLCKVVRVIPVPGSIALDVSVCRPA